MQKTLSLAFRMAKILDTQNDGLSDLKVVTFIRYKLELYEVYAVLNMEPNSNGVVHSKVDSRLKAIIE